MVVLDVGPDEARFRLLETVRAFAVQQVEQAGEGDLLAEAHARWMAGLTDPGGWDIYSPACQQQTVRLEREVPAWRAALTHGRRSGDHDLVRRAVRSRDRHARARPGRPGGHDPRGDRRSPTRDPGRLSGALGGWSRAFAVKDAAGLTASLVAIRDLDPQDTSGLARMLESAQLIILTEEVEQATRLRADCAADPLAPPGLRDNLLANALYGVAMCGRLDLMEPGWPAAVEEISRTSEVATTRLVGRLALARATMISDPEASRRHLRAADEEQGEMPLMLRRIWRAGLFRLMRVTDPAGGCRRGCWG